MNKQLLAPTHPTHLDPAVELEQAQDAATVCCDMCPHPLDQHDAIARRFCTATSAGALSAAASVLDPEHSGDSERAFAATCDARTNSVAHSAQV